MCSECDKVFANPYNLEKHMKTPLKCTKMQEGIQVSRGGKASQEGTLCVQCATKIFTLFQNSQNILYQYTSSL